MRNILRASILTLALGLVTSLAAPATGFAQDMWGANDGLASGQGGYAWGTNIYNTFVSPNDPLPMTGGNVAPDTLYNLGAGQSLGDAWSNAATSNSGLSTYVAPVPYSPVPPDAYSPVPLDSDPDSNPVPGSSTPAPSYTPAPINFFSGTAPASGGDCEASACSAQ